MSYNIPGYIKLTVGEIRQWTDKIVLFVDEYEKCYAKAMQEEDERISKQSWFYKTFLWNDPDEMSERAAILNKHIPKYLRGSIFIDWEKHVRGFSDDRVILMDIDDAELLRSIANKLSEGLTTKENQP